MVSSSQLNLSVNFKTNLIINISAFWLLFVRHIRMILSDIVSQLQIFQKSTAVNVSHIIHDLSFGPKYPGIHNPLDGTTRFLHGASGIFKYYIKVCFLWIKIIICSFFSLAEMTVLNFLVIDNYSFCRSFLQTIITFRKMYYLQINIQSQNIFHHWTSSPIIGQVSWHKSA